jgi:hypothetical protein
MGNTSEVKELLEGGDDVNEKNNVSTKFVAWVSRFPKIYS